MLRVLGPRRSAGLRCPAGPRTRTRQRAASLYFYTLKDGLPVHRSVLTGLEREGWLTRETVTVAGIYKRWKLTPKGERQLQGLKTDEQ